jgi:hypothetical protein
MVEDMVYTLLTLYFPPGGHLRKVTLHSEPHMNDLCHFSLFEMYHLSSLVKTIYWYIKYTRVLD